MNKILITGGAGYIGTVLTELLLEKNYQVTIYDRLMYDGTPLINFFSNDNFSFVNGDILDKEKLRKEISKVDCVIHLAAIVGYLACDNNKQMTKDVKSFINKSILSLCDIPKAVANLYAILIPLSITISSA